MNKYLSLIVILALAVVTLLALPLLPIEQGGHEAVDTKVVTIWHIESYEGGNGSRASWLRQRMAEVEKKNQGLIVDVITYTTQQAIDKLEQGEQFHLISFGNGVDILPYLAPYTGSVGQCYGNLLLGGQVNNVQYAVPYMMGVYALFARNSDMDTVKADSLLDNVFTSGMTKRVGKNTLQLQSLGVGYAVCNNPLEALAVNDVKGSYTADLSLTQYKAYELFAMGNSYTILLGTQRDMYRLNHRMEQGRISTVHCEVLGGYSDLVQYIAVSDCGSDTMLYNTIIEHLISDNVQIQLSKVQMLSTTGIDIYSSNVWMDSAEQLTNDMVTVNAFTDSVTLYNNRQHSYSVISSSGS